MNILVCTSTNSSVNSLRPELEIYISMANSGHEITLITHHNDHYHQKLVDAGINVILEPVVKKISLNSIRLINSTIQKKKIDIVFATNSKAIPNAAFACIGTSAKLIIYRGTAKGLYWHDPGSYLGGLHPRIDGIICVSQYVADYVSSKYLLRNKSIKAIYKGHDLSWYQQGEANLNELGISKEDFTLIAVINARPHKGLDIVLKSTFQLADLEKLNILLVGKGADKNPYKQLHDASPMRERIHVLGYRNDAPELIKSSNVLLQPSTSGEGLPRVILEALASGTPVIASANPGSMEIIEDGVNGFIVPIADPDALAKQIRMLYTSPEKIAELTQHCSDVIEKKMSHRLTVEQYLDFFSQSLNS